MGLGKSQRLRLCCRAIRGAAKSLFAAELRYRGRKTTVRPSEIEHQFRHLWKRYALRSLASSNAGKSAHAAMIKVLLRVGHLIVEVQRLTAAR